MWRAFFFSVGIVVAILGLQCLVVDRFYVQQEGRLGAWANKALNLLDPDEASNSDPSTGFGQLGLANTNSAYGPSRFQASPYSQQQGSPFQFNQSNSPFQLTGNRSTAGGDNSIPKPPREFPTQDWMPWSLLAVGTIIVLYTKSTTSGDYLASE